MSAKINTAKYRASRKRLVQLSCNLINSAATFCLCFFKHAFVRQLLESLMGDSWNLGHRRPDTSFLLMLNIYLTNRRSLLTLDVRAFPPNLWITRSGVKISQLGV